ncbi:MAG TPA: hypothetical protein DCR55_05730 [Lentisphaeria bacterium]|nr:hypothetical protein [Lentisphaeria bacterium]
MGANNHEREEATVNDHTDDLQFDQAEFHEPQATMPSDCGHCQEPVRDTYYLCNSEAWCDTCANAFQTSSGFFRFIKALIFGFIAGAIGSGIYYAVLALTGYEIGLIAIAVGFLVGLGVATGSGGRGGWVYQLLAVALTYSAIVTTHVPLILKELKPMMAGVSEGPDGEQAAMPATGDEPEEGEQVADAEVADAADPMPPVALSGLQNLVMLIMAFAFAFVAPVLSGLGNIIGILIICFALYQAWSMNRKREYAFEGPYSAEGNGA